MPSDLPDWYAASVLTGWNGTQHRTLKVLETGELYAMLKCKYDELIKDVKGDIAGNLTLNVKAQDLAEIISRPKYGGARMIEAAISCDEDEWTTLFTLSSKGMIYGGSIIQAYAGADGYSSVKLTIDGREFCNYTFAITKDMPCPSSFTLPLYTTKFDPVNEEYHLFFSYGITFETSIKVEVYNLGPTHDFSYRLHYALV